MAGCVQKYRDDPYWSAQHTLVACYLGDKDDEIRLLGVNKTSQDPILLI